MQVSTSNISKNAGVPASPGRNRH